MGDKKEMEDDVKSEANETMEEKENDEEAMVENDDQYWLQLETVDERKYEKVFVQGVFFHWASPKKSPNSCWSIPTGPPLVLPKKLLEYMDWASPKSSYSLSARLGFPKIQ